MPESIETFGTHQEIDLQECNKRNGLTEIPTAAWAELRLQKETSDETARNENSKWSVEIKNVEKTSRGFPPPI